MTATAPIFQQQTISAMPGNWSQTVPFDQFDPSIGDLADAAFTTAGTVDASASIENLAPVAATVSLGIAATIDAWIVGGQNVAPATPIAVASVNLGAFQGTFDGTLNFAGPSGTVLPEITATQTQTAVINPSEPGQSPLLGTGTFDVEVTSYATSTVEGNGNLAVLTHGSTGAVLSLRYDPAGPGSIDDDGGGSFSLVAPVILPIGTVINYVTSTPQVVTLQSATSGWISTASFTRFDPALGRLDEIILNVGNTIAGTFSAENLENMPASVAMSEAAIMMVASPGDGAGVTATATGFDDLSLGTFDGSADSGGTSGRSDAIVDSPPEPAGWNPGFVYPTFDHAGVGTLTSGTDLKAFTGTGTIALPVSTEGTSTVTGPINLLTEITQQTGGTVSISYVYTPVAASTEPNGPFAPGPAGIVGQTGPSGPAVGEPGWKVGTSVGLFASSAPRMTFIGGLMGGTYLEAHPDQTFLIGTARTGPGATETIDNFSPTGGDRLDLTALLTGAPLAYDLSNLAAFLNVTGQSATATGAGTNTTLAVSGPGGAVSLVLESAGSISVVDLLSNNALVLPGH